MKKIQKKSSPDVQLRKRLPPAVAKGLIDDQRRRASDDEYEREMRLRKELLCRRRSKLRQELHLESSAVKPVETRQSVSSDKSSSKSFDDVFEREVENSTDLVDKATVAAPYIVCLENQTPDLTPIEKRNFFTVEDDGFCDEIQEATALADISPPNDCCTDSSESGISPGGAGDASNGLKSNGVSEYATQAFLYDSPKYIAPLYPLPFTRTEKSVNEGSKLSWTASRTLTSTRNTFKNAQSGDCKNEKFYSKTPVSQSDEKESNIRQGSQYDKSVCYSVGAIRRLVWSMSEEGSQKCSPYSPDIKFDTKEMLGTLNYQHNSNLSKAVRQIQKPEMNHRRSRSVTRKDESSSIMTATIGHRSKSTFEDILSQIRRPTLYRQFSVGDDKVDSPTILTEEKPVKRADDFQKAYKATTHHFTTPKVQHAVIVTVKPSSTETVPAAKQEKMQPSPVSYIFSPSSTIRCKLCRSACY